MFAILVTSNTKEKDYDLQLFVSFIFVEICFLASCVASPHQIKNGSLVFRDETTQRKKCFK
jgi:hypothetical protein